MALPDENILQNLVNATSLAEISAEQLQQVIDEHPYYGAAQVLLAKKLFLTKETDYNEATHKASLHFSNPLWLNYILNDEKDTLETYTPSQNLNITTAPTEENVALTTPGQKDEKQVIPETDILNDNIKEEADEESYDESGLAETESQGDAISQRLSSMLQEQASALEKPVEETAQVPIENVPYHRVDYFESQGIKLEEEKENENDQLGKKLKKFTDWLRQMKRSNPNPVDLGNDEAGEKQVQNIAEHSNEGEEIVTEAMAEVLLKQGKPEQAIDIYKKLSFNNPDKSAYFAAKIEELKDKK